MKKVGKLLLILIVLVLIASIAFVTVNFIRSKTEKKANPIVKIEIEGYGTVEIELYPDVAPNTVKNFIRLAERGYYDNKPITDIEKGSLIRAGLDITTNSSGKEVATGPKLSNIKDLKDGEEDMSYAIKGEFAESGYIGNKMSFKKGTIAMYRSTYYQYEQYFQMLHTIGYKEQANMIFDQLYDSQSSGFFIMAKDDSTFDGNYAAFGQVVKGIEIVEAISNLEVVKEVDDDGHEEETTKPVQAPVIKKVTVDTKGIKYGEPEVIRNPEIEATFDLLMSGFMSSSGTNLSY